MPSVPNANILSPAQIAVYAQNAGFSGNDLAIAVAIAMAESGGNPNTYNPETAAGAPDGEGSYGLWQIYLHAHPEYAFANLYDPQTNANAAFAIYSAAGGFSPWSTFNSGAYQAFLVPAATIPTPAVPGLTSTDTSEASMFPPLGLNLESALWIGGAILVGWALFSFLE